MSHQLFTGTTLPAGVVTNNNPSKELCSYSKFYGDTKEGSFRQDLPYTTIGRSSHRMFMNVSLHIADYHNVARKKLRLFFKHDLQQLRIRWQRRCRHLSLGFRHRSAACSGKTFQIYVQKVMA